MSPSQRALVLWFYITATALTFISLSFVLVCEVYIRWFLNQNFSLLDANGLASLAILLAAQMLGLAWLSRSS